MNDPRIIVALDYANARDAIALAGRLEPALCRLKVGKELFTAAGPALIETLVQRGFAIFLDLKYHDIPNTVASACTAAAALGVWMINVHAMGGRAMMQAAREALCAHKLPPKLIAVTLLTSMSESDLADIGLNCQPKEMVLRLARLAQSCELDGVVCSAQEAQMLKAECGRNFCLVTPGIRPAQAGVDDQKRIMTPEAAMASGADYLVIGRPITRAEDPLAALVNMNRAITQKGSS